MDLMHLSNQDLEWALGKELLPKYKRMVQAELGKRYFSDGTNRYLHLKNVAPESVRKHMNAHKRFVNAQNEYWSLARPFLEELEHIGVPVHERPRVLKNRTNLRELMNRQRKAQQNMINARSLI